MGEGLAARDAGTSQLGQRTLSAVDAAIARFHDLGRRDLAERLATTRARLDRTQTVICVVGEFKQGKSALVNALVGAGLCPVDDDMATAAPTVLYYAEQPEARVRIGSEHDPEVHAISLEQVAEFAREDPLTGNGHRVELIEIGHPSPVLQRGVSIVDMPGAGGIQSGRAEAILGFLPTADALIFASDASAELAAPELRFLREATARCPTVLVALTKIDLYADWQRIAELDTGHLDNWNVAVTDVIGVSADLRIEALRRNDRDLNAESGIRRLLEQLRLQVVDRASHLACARALSETRRSLIDLTNAARRQYTALEDPDRRQSVIAELQAARDHVAALRKTGSRWSVVLSDGFSDLLQHNDELLRTGVRDLLHDVDERLEGADPAAEWRGLVAEVQRRVASIANDLADARLRQSTAIAAAAAEIIGDDPPVEIEATSDLLETERLWEAAGKDLSSGPSRSERILTAVRGGSSGVILLGVIGSLAGMALASPIALGAGFVFGARQFVDDRNKQAEMRRREARGIVQQYLRQAQVELTAQDRRAVQETHRALRDHFSERISELDRTSTETVASLQQSLKQEQAAQQRRLEYLRTNIAELDALVRNVEDLQMQIEGGTT